MKKSKALGFLAMASMFSALTSDSYEMTKQGNVGSSKEPDNTPPKEPTPFNKQEGILNLIKDYKLIKQGESKKGTVKQARTLSKIQELLDSGHLTEEDLK